MTTHLPALLLSALGGLLVLAVPWALRPAPRVRTRTGVRPVTLAPSWAAAQRRRRWLVVRLSHRLLPGPVRLLGRVLVLDADGPAARALRWRLIHAGVRRAPAWVRTRQLVIAGAFAAVSVAALATGVLPAPWTLPLLAASGSAGLALPLLDLSYRTRERRTRLRYELVDLLYDLAALVGAGLTLEAALHEVASGDGDLVSELRTTLALQGAGVPLDETLALLAERCATDEVTGALRRIVALRSGGGRMAPTVRELAEATRTTLREARRVQKAQALLTTTALLALLGLPPFLVALLYPVVVQALRGVQ